MNSRARSAALWLWMLATVVATGYLAIMLVALFFMGIEPDRTVGELAFMGALAASPFVVFATLFISLRPWGNRAGQTLVTATFTAPVAVVALGIRLFTG